MTNLATKRIRRPETRGNENENKSSSVMMSNAVMNCHRWNYCFRQLQGLSPYPERWMYRITDQSRALLNWDSPDSIQLTICKNDKYRGNYPSRAEGECCP